MFYGIIIGHYSQKGDFMKGANTLLNTNTPMGLFNKKGDVEIDKVVDFMAVSKEQLASAFGFRGEQLRSDKMASRTKEIIQELAGAIEHVATILSEDKNKTLKWFNLPNVHFGGSTPKAVILSGRFRRVKNFIYSSHKR